MYELLRKYFWEQNLFREFLYTPVYPLPVPPRAITHGLRGQQVKSNIKVAADVFLVVTPRHGTLKHPLSVSKYFPSSFKHKLSVTAYNLSQIANSKYIICIKYTNRV